MDTSFVLADIHDLSPIFSPLKNSQRIKYTCFNVSPTLLVFGASSGGLYVFRREPCSFIQLLPNQEGAITHVAISPDEKLFAFASVKGAVCVLEKSSSGIGAQRIFYSSEHIGVKVTALQWSGRSNELFIGDQLGKVSIVSLLPFKMKNMFYPPSCTLMVLDSQIVQLDWLADMLLVSTLTRSYICDVPKEYFCPIGVKPRDGEFGACFYVQEDIPMKIQPRTETVKGSFAFLSDRDKDREHEEFEHIKAFCARPGSRLWEVHINGTVLNTHQFKQALAIPPTAIIRLPRSTDSSQQDNKPPDGTNKGASDVIINKQSFNFSKLRVLAKRYLFTFKKDGIYIFDPEKATVILWSNDIKDIVDAQVVKDLIYVLTSSGNMFGILFAPLEKFLVRLYLRRQYELCAELCEIHIKYLMKEAPNSTKLYLLADLGTKLSNDEVAERILPLLQEIAKCASENRRAKRLDSGIYVLENRHFHSRLNSEPFMPDFPLKRSERFREKPRSLSVSPERSRRRRKDSSKGSSSSRRSNSSSSLPELGETNDKSAVSANDAASADFPNGSGSCENSGVKKSSKEFFTSFDTSPEAIQALKDIGQTVSSKITSSTIKLKEKWQVLEGKILGSETAPDLSDVRTEDYTETSMSGETTLEKCDDSDIVFSLRGGSTREKNKLHNELDTGKILLVLQKIGNFEKTDGEEFRLSIHDLLDEIIYLYNSYCTLVTNENVNGNIRSPEVISDEGDSKSSMYYFLYKFSGKSFPFPDFFSDDIIKILAEKFSLSFSASILFSWIQNLRTYVQCKSDEPDLLAFFPVEAILEDYLLSRLLIVCSDLLDPHTILQMIKSCGISCYYKSFCTVLDKYQAGALQQVSKENSVESSCWQWPLPLRLNAMFCMLQMNQIETCSMMGNNIDILDVFYLVLRLQQEQACTGDDSRKAHAFFMFLSYLNRVADFESVMETLLRNKYLVSFTTKAFELVNEGVAGSCRCGFPFPVKKSSEVQFEEIGRILCNHLRQTNHERHRELCERVPVMWKHMLISTLDEDFESVLPLLVQLGDFSVLSLHLKKMNMRLWEQALDMAVTVTSGQCLKCGVITIPQELRESGTISEIGMLVVKALGPSSAVSLLSKSPVNTGCGILDARFYQSCIFSAIVDSHSKGLRSEVVDMVSRAASASSTTPLVSHEFGKLLEETLALDLAKVSVSSAEAGSSKHHWGTQVDLRGGSCPCCSLPLGSPVLLEDGGITVFQCSHAFHTVCLKQRPSFTCLVCNKLS